MTFRNIFPRSRSPRTDSSNEKHRPIQSNNPFSRSNRPSPPPIDAPPPYNADAPPSSLTLLQRLPTFRNTAAPDPYALLARFDTIFLIDDSGSMSGSNWRQTSAALSTIVPICTTHDSDGVDIHFLNSRLSGVQITSSDQVLGLFQRVTPSGTTPTGARLNALLQTYLNAFRRNQNIKPLNIICITDGEPSDPGKLERAIVKAAKELDDLKAADRQVGVQFFQVGSDEGATEALEDLDNSLVEEHGVRDMVDTVSWKQMNGGRGLSGDGILKAVMGAIDKRLDQKRRLH
ncbi:hypothetical protein BDD12DRAFT_819251 [Trichophaea hybrida]|nr:hypothetical protein BDD12DRAFT_819251 [Trichophaea hybrida]